MNYQLLTVNQTKMNKSTAEGYLSAVLHLEPAYKIGDLDTCPNAGICKGTCIAKTGRMRFDSAQTARIRRTELLAHDPYYFMRVLDAEIHQHTWQARKLGLKPTVRLNGTSDIRWKHYKQLRQTIFDLHPTTQFLDYTKLPDQVNLGIPNYTVVFSASEKATEQEISTILDNYGRVAQVFNVKRGEQLPNLHKVNGKLYRVVDGDTHDLLHLRPLGVILGLRYKLAFSSKTRKALKPNKRFVILPEVI